MRVSVAVVNGVIWLLLFLSNLLLLLGCASPALTGNAIYQVDVRHLIANLEAEASEGANQNVTLGGNTLLPTHWRIGLGGVCDIFKENNEVRCRHSLAPSQKLLSILEACLRDNLSRQYQSEDKGSGDALGSLEDRVSNVLSTWSHALANLDPHRLAKHEGHATRLVRACAVFIIIVLLMDFWAAWSVIVKEDNEIAALKLFCSTICCLAAGVCIAAVFDTTILRVAGQHEGYIGAAVATPFAGMVFRFFYYQIMESCPEWCGLRQKPNQFAGKARVHSRTTTTTDVAMSPIAAAPELEAGDVNQPPAATTPRRTSQDSKPEVDNIGTIDAPRGYIPRDGLVVATNNSQV